jgi:SnoaL-like domain
MRGRAARAYRRAMDTTDPRARPRRDPSSRHRSPVPLLVSALALVTGLVLGTVGATLGEPTRSLPPASVPPTTTAVPAAEAARALAVRFYAALDAALASGDAAPLAGVVSPDFVDHTQDPGAARGMAGATAAVAALRAARPGLRVTVAAALVDGDRALVYLAGTRWGDAVEVLRLADGRVAERWALTGGWSAGAAGCALKTGQQGCVP